MLPNIYVVRVQLFGGSAFTKEYIFGLKVGALCLLTDA